EFRRVLFRSRSTRYRWKILRRKQRKRSSFSLTYKRILQTGRELFVVSFFVPVHTLLNKGVKVCPMSGERSDRDEKNSEIVDHGDPGLSGNLLVSHSGTGIG